MKIKNKSLIIFGFLVFSLVSIPCTAYAIDGVTDIDSGYNYMVSLTGISSSGSFTSNASIIVFISDMDGVNYFHSFGTAPPSALWSTTGFSGSWSNIVIAGESNYLFFGNKGGSSTAHVSYSYTAGGSIPGFELIFVLFSVISIVSFIIYNKEKIVVIK